MKATLILIFLTCIGWSSFAQKNSVPINYKAEFMKRPLLVVANNYYESFKKIMDDKWKLGNPSIQYVTREEAQKLWKEKKDYYALLEVGKVSGLEYSEVECVVLGSIPLGGIFNVDVYFVSFPFEKINDFDFQIAIEHFNSYIPLLANNQATFDILSDIETLRKKTLLIPSEWIDPMLTKQAIEFAYGGPIRIEKLETIKEMVVDESDKYAFVYAINGLVGRNPFFVALEANNFNVLSAVNLGGVYVFGSKMGKNYMKEKHFKYFLREEGQIENRKTLNYSGKY